MYKCIFNNTIKINRHTENCINLKILKQNNKLCVLRHYIFKYK